MKKPLKTINDNHKKLVLDTSVLVYYVYGNEHQKSRIKNIIKKFKNNVLINPILRSEIGRVIFKPFFELKGYIEKFLSIQPKFNIDDLWINITQKISRRKSNQLVKRSFLIITHIRNVINKIPLNKTDSNYLEKELDRIRTCINIFIEDILFEFKDEFSLWDIKNTFDCPQSKWEIEYNKIKNNYEYLYDERCTYICNNREMKLNNLTIKFKTVFLKILKKGQNFCKREKINPDTRFFSTIGKLIKINKGFKKFDFRTKYCNNLGDFLISILLLNSNNKIYTYNIKDFKLILHFLNIPENRIIPFN